MFRFNEILVDFYVYKIMSSHSWRGQNLGEQCLPPSSQVAWWRRQDTQEKQVRLVTGMGAGAEPTVLCEPEGWEALSTQETVSPSDLHASSRLSTQEPCSSIHQRFRGHLLCAALILRHHIVP